MPWHLALIWYPVDVCSFEIALFFCSVFGDPHRQWKFRIEDRGGPPPTNVSICVSNFSARACSHWGPQPTMSTYITYDVYILLFACLQNVRFCPLGTCQLI